MRIAQNAAEIHLKKPITILSSIWHGIQQKVAILFEHELEGEKTGKGSEGKKGVKVRTDESVDVSSSNSDSLQCLTQ